MSVNPERQTDPSLRPTSVSTLVVAALAAAATAWLLISTSDLFYRISPLPWTGAGVLAVLAIAEAYLAQNTSARIQRKPGSLPVHALSVARFAALAKASSLVGALSSGFSAGLLLWLVMEPTDEAGSSVPVAATTLVTAVALIAAALWLERSCRVPDNPENEGDETGRR
ncbi:DUF3180 domain-containing protein [Actinoplanes couchii]|uniref:Secreted protein n=1 Tax=Actinoplanes couchii TaxID=403638 RepID=A0ABQ3XAR1_9ACTN|nr:DUF3180 domain-containing protein [Actinoplanes couchii]MDR6324814.1 hypothetical protein [Actinoplanes couchii]GID55565.1 hypothetical protein Aco03nite_039690 [Actinoplanes couchii]